MWLAEVRDAIAFRPPAWKRASRPGGCIRCRRCGALQPLLDSHPDSVFVCDGGEFGQWAQACLTAPHRVINGVAGSIGSALPFAIGARLRAADAPVLAVLGDGTFGFHAAEIDTAVRYELALRRDRGQRRRWNAEYQIQLRDYGAERRSAASCCPRATTRWPRRSAGTASWSPRPRTCRRRWSARTLGTAGVRQRDGRGGGGAADRALT